MKKTNGFTLVEVLVAMIVLALGLLGLAGLQTLSIRNNMNAYQRGQAIQLIYDMTDRIRANNPRNPDGTAKIDTVTGKKYISYCESSYMKPEIATEKNTCVYYIRPTALPAPTVCNTKAMIENDLFDWNRSIRASLQLGIGRITAQVNGAVTVYTISITWDSNRSGAIESSATTQFPEPDSTFSASFQI